jgi:SAM-dependent methyltransferase
VVPGTEGYADEACELVERYERVPSEEKHRAVLHLIPRIACRVLDVGAGTGVDAAWFADKGHRVVAVEPTDALRVPGMRLHPSPSIEWISDSLPHLGVVMARPERFDLIMLSAMWMHLDEGERSLAMLTVASLLADGGVLLLSLRHGPVPSRRRMFAVSAEETIDLAQRCGLRAVLNVHTQSVQALNRRAGVTWSRLGFERRDMPVPGVSDAGGRDAAGGGVRWVRP